MPARTQAHSPAAIDRLRRSVADGTPSDPFRINLRHLRALAAVAAAGSIAGAADGLYRVRSTVTRTARSSTRDDTDQTPPRARRPSTTRT